MLNESFILTMREEDKIKFDDEIIVIKLKFNLIRRKQEKPFLISANICVLYDCASKLLEGLRSLFSLLS